MENDTVFGAIIRGEIPAIKVYEDDLFLAFLDNNPVTKGHALLIPKHRYTWVHEVPDDTIAAIFVKAKEIICAMCKGLPCDYVQLSVVGNEVPHFHIHLIPRKHDATAPITTRPHESYTSNEEAVTIAEQISLSLE